MGRHVGPRFWARTTDSSEMLSYLLLAMTIRSSLAFAFSGGSSSTLQSLCSHRTSLCHEASPLQLGSAFTTRRSSTHARPHDFGRKHSLQMLMDVPKQVLVTGASGKTGFFTFKVLSDLQPQPSFSDVRPTCFRNYGSSRRNFSPRALFTQKREPKSSRALAPLWETAPPSSNRTRS